MLENKRKKEANHEQGSFQGKDNEEAVRRESVPHPRKTTRPQSSSRKEWAAAGQAAKLRRKSAQSARTTAKKANVGNVICGAEADTIQEHNATLERQPQATDTTRGTAIPPTRPLCTYDAIRCAPYYLATVSPRGDEIL
jgi:hypothetical protein